MSGKLKAEIKQHRPFRSQEAEAALNIHKTADVLEARMAEVLKPSGLSPTQYNVLRILRGAHRDNLEGVGGCRQGGTLACGEVADRMISREPDMTRMLDRLEKRGLISRARDEKDRRVVCTRITDAGLELVDGLDQPVDSLVRQQLGHLGPEKLQRLIDLLEEVRTDP
jgi:MarR family transcriptional regulator, organic hydroperoxide resistance regulator